MRSHALLMGAALLAAGCVGALEEAAAGPRGTPPRVPPVTPTCTDAQILPGGTAMRRLTGEEHRRTVADLFPGVAIPRYELARDARLGGFDNLADAQAISPLLTEQHHRAAGLVAAAASSALASWAPCSTNDAACAARIVEHVAMRAQRRPLTDEERATLVSFVESARAADGLAASVSMLIEALLLTPQFLFRPELGDPSRAAPAGTRALDGYEVASRLSYFLFRTMPDDTLFEAAASGELDTVTGIEAHARRMLEDVRARDTIADLHAQWFQTWRVEDELRLDADAFPELDAAVARDLRASLDLFLADAFFRDGTMSALFDGRYAYLNDRIAPLFGVSAPGSSELVRVELPADVPRAGILTQPGWLTHRSHPTVHSPIYRGVFVRDHVLCASTGDPPAGAEGMSEPLPPDVVLTTRERTERSHSGRCAACHQRIDGVGFAFEHYDALGRYRDTEFDLPIDARGEVVDAGDADGPIADALDLAARVASSDRVRTCVATHYVRYALGRLESRADDCQLRALADRLAESGGDLVELAVAITASPSFRHRTIDAGGAP